MCIAFESSVINLIWNKKQSFTIWKFLTMSSTLAYYTQEYITQQKKFCRICSKSNFHKTICLFAIQGCDYHWDWADINYRIRSIAQVSWKLPRVLIVQLRMKLTYQLWLTRIGPKLFDPLGSILSENTKGGSITVLLSSCLTGLELAVWQMTILVFICKTD